MAIVAVTFAAGAADAAGLADDALGPVPLEELLPVPALHPPSDATTSVTRHQIPRRRRHIWMSSLMASR
jgi:hypothetical protein